MNKTPTTPQAMEKAIDTKNVKVEMGASNGGLPTTAKLAHALAITVSAVIALCVSSVLADGTSVIKLKDVRHLPIITDPSLKSQGISYRADQLLGPTYGIGLHHDQSGRSWTEIGAGSTAADLVQNLGIPVIAAALPSVIATDGLKHPVPLLGCDDLQKAGLSAMSLGYIAEAVSVVMVIFHALALAGLLPAGLSKVLGSLVWLVLTAGFLIVVLIAIGVYHAHWTCHNVIIPSLVLSDHFDYNYGFVYAVVGFVSSLLVFNTHLNFTSTKDGASDAPKPNCGKAICKTVCGVSIGAVLAVVGCMVVMGGAGGFNAPAAADPDVNPCEGKKPKHAGPGDNYFTNTECTFDSITQTLEQAGANVTRGYKGQLDAGNRVPITDAYDQTDLCPVNVHWHLGAEHLSVGEYDSHGKGPVADGSGSGSSRRLAENARLGNRCHHYKADDAKFTTEYNWQHCTGMKIGETYEIHWPHSAAGACGTKFQYQTPFYDGVFCNDGIISIAPLNTYQKIGVQAQVFTIVNSDASEYQYDDLINGMIVSGAKGDDIAKYTGSTTGTSRDNQICSRYTPITWQVDRKCHMVSAASFDKLCQDMLAQADDMSGDIYPHGAREVVADHLVANNQQTRK